MLGRSLPTCRNLPGHRQGVYHFVFPSAVAHTLPGEGAGPVGGTWHSCGRAPRMLPWSLTPQPSAPSWSYRTFLKRFFSDGFTNPL